MTWVAEMVDECKRDIGDERFYRTKREGNRVLLIQQCSNAYGIFVRLSELGNSAGKGMIVIPEGRKRRRWAGFVE